MTAPGPDPADLVEGDSLADVVARYDEPHRRHHGRAHLLQVLADTDRLLAAVPVPDEQAVRLAALFHDAVYDPSSSSNEADSAALARSRLDGLVPDATVAAVERLVLSTAAHVPAATDEAVLSDADLAVLGADPAAYAAYVAGVRAEYGHLGDDAWRGGRAAVLRSFLERPAIYATPPMRGRDAAARANLAGELARLGGGR